MERTIAVDLDKMADRVAEKALDEFTYKDKTLREWIELIVTADSILEIAEEKVINNLNSLKGNWGCDYHKNGVISDCISAVHNSFEKMKGKRQTAEWIIDSNDKDYCYCQACRHRFDIDHLKMVWGTYEFPPHCPNCGEKLKGENKDNWFAEMEEAEKRYEHEKWVESLEKGKKE